jgi:hypothetical protein
MNFILTNDVVNRDWELFHEKPSIFMSNDSWCRRISLQGFKGSIQAKQKLGSKTLFFFFITSKDISYVTLSLVADDKFVIHRSSFRFFFTSVHGVPSSGEAKNASYRESSILFCSSERGSSPMSSDISSHRSLISSSFSDLERVLMFSASITQGKQRRVF